MREIKFSKYSKYYDRRHLEYSVYEIEFKISGRRIKVGFFYPYLGKKFGISYGWVSNQFNIFNFAVAWELKGRIK